MNFWANFWDFVGFFFWSFAFISYLFALFAVVADLFRDRKLNGWGKAIWMVCLIFVPFLTVLVYVIARGAGMAERQVESTVRARSEADDYIRSVATASPVQEITQAKGLLDAGVINNGEFEVLKAKAMGRERSTSDTD